MKKYLLFIVLTFNIFIARSQTLLLNESFNYPVGDTLTKYGWVTHSGTANILLVKSGSLSYNQYPASSGNSIILKNNGQDVNKSFTGQTSGSVYVAALVKVDSATTNGEYFMHFMRNSTTFYGRVYIKKSSTNSSMFSFGILKGTTTANIVYSPETYTFDTTYLLVLKYKINSGTANDSVSLFINPQYNDEGTPIIKASDASSTDLDSVYSVALRQGTATNNLYVDIDEIRVSTSWYNTIGFYTIPTVSTLTTTNITTNTATCNGNVLLNGGSAITARGICYDTTSNPSLLNLYTIETGELGSFSSNLSGLILGKTYHYRAYATNNSGTTYGADSVFITTSSAVLPILTTNTTSNITHNSATLNGNIISDGGANITLRGFCWSTVSNPTINDSVINISGTTGLYSANISNLISNTTYHVRAFATNSAGTSYGNDVSFTTLVFVPTYTISQVRSINATTGVADSIGVNCKLLGVVHGINFSTTGYNFYIMNSQAGINVIRTSTLSYTVAEGDSIRAIGKIQQPNGQVNITLDSIVKISSSNSLINSIVVNSLNDTLESRLVKINNLTYLSNWPTTAGNTRTVYALNGSDSVTIMIHTNCNLQGTPAPTTTFNLTGIVNQSDNSSPYFQGYRIYPRYIADVELNLTIPTVLTSSVSNISMTGATCNGNVTANGGSTILSRGICYSTSINPDTSGLHTVLTGATGNFSSIISGLTQNTLYHYRAYAINSTGLAYGADSVFTTAASPLVPTVTTDTVYNIYFYDATITSTVQNDGGANVTSRGICWSTNTNPTTSDSVMYNIGTTGTFVLNIANLIPNTTYYVRAFAINSSGTGYGNNLTFTTKKIIPNYSIQQVKGINSLGVADSINVICKLTGIVHGLNFLANNNPNGLTFFIMDSTAGINVYKTSNLGYTVTEGDKISVYGKIAQVSGLIQIQPDSINVISTSNTLFNPQIVNLPDETVESKLVKVENLYYLSGWPTTAGTTKTVYAVKGADTVIIRIFSNCNLQGTPAPTATVSFSITGLVNQSDNTSPYTSGYQILPRNTSDLTINYTNPTVITGSATGITQYTAIINGSIPTDGGYSITSRGVCYGYNANPTITADSIKTSTGTTGNFSINLTPLALNTTYHYRIYCVNSQGTFYGNDSVFTTSLNPVVPVLTTTAATNIGFTYATVGGTIVNNGGDTIITKGICWGVNHNPTINDSISIVTGTSATFTSTLNNLNENTIYYARAYATSAVGTGYGYEITFITKKLPPVYTIEQVKGINSNGIADSLNVNCKLYGVVHGINYKQTAMFMGLNFFIEDATAGINVYKTTNLSYTPVEGDLIKVIGKISQTNGLTQIVPDSLVLMSSGNPTNTPTIVTSINESVESKLVTLENLTYLSGWPSTVGTTTVSALALKGSDTITIRLYLNCNMQAIAAPTGITFNINGFVGQIDNTSPYTSGYVIIPRDSNDLVNTTSVSEIKENKVLIYPNPAKDNVIVSLEDIRNSEIEIYSMIGVLLSKQKAINKTTNIDISGFEKGMYFISIVNKANQKIITEKLIIK